MTIQTDYYGEVEYENADLITAIDDLFGFPNLKYFLPLCLNEEDDSMILMQSTENPEVAFVVINPYLLCSDYAPVLTPEELRCLEVTDPGELSYFAICVLRDNFLENTVNLKCPFVMNPVTRKGMQVILNGTSYGFRHKFSSFLGTAQPVNSENRSDSNADSKTQKK